MKNYIKQLQKTCFILSILFLLNPSNNLLKAQNAYYVFDFNFESEFGEIFSDLYEIGDTTCELIIDTLNPNNLWQIGTPQKEYFDSAYNRSKRAIITDTVNYYPANNHSFFTIKIKPNLDLCWSEVFMAYWHKFETEENKSGGYVEISYGGNNWINIIEDRDVGLYTYGSHYYSKEDTLINDKIGFSGINEVYHDGWSTSQFSWFRDDEYATKHDSIFIRFNFISSDDDTTHEGWMIDGLFIEIIDRCGMDISEFAPEKDIIVSPNPIENISFIQLNNNYKTIEFEVFNISGQRVLKKSFSGSVVEIKKSDFKFPGLYFYRINYNKQKYSIGKFIVQ